MSNSRFEGGKKKVSVFIDSYVVRGSSTLALPQPVFVTVYPVSATIIGCAELFSFHAAPPPPSDAELVGQKGDFIKRVALSNIE